MTDTELVYLLKAAHEKWESLDQEVKNLVELIVPSNASNDFLNGFITATSIFESINRANPELSKNDLIGAIILMGKKCLSVRYINFLKELKGNDSVN
jgi:hypothetical protein